MTEEIWSRGMTLGPAILRLRRRQSALAFYEQALGLSASTADPASLPPGLALHTEDGPAAPAATYALKATEAQDPVIYLVIDPQATVRPSGTTGLYHLALRVPHRDHLARFLRHIMQQGVNLQGLSDHGVSEAIYMQDPDRNGLEVYADRPRHAWPTDADGVAMTTRPLDVEDLLAAAPEPAPLPLDTDLGHIHLQVGDLAAAEDFYCRTLGLQLMQRYGQSAIFVAAGGYHHHIGLNSWAGAGAVAPPANSTGLIACGLKAGDRDAITRLVSRLEGGEVPHTAAGGRLWLQDPAGHQLWIEVSSDAAASGPAGSAGSTEGAPEGA